MTAMATFAVAVTDDALLEATETVIATISNPSNAAVTISTASATANITDNDTATLSINDITQNETDAGTTAFTFTVTLDTEVDTGVSFDFATANDTATTADSDYTGLSTTTRNFASTAAGATETIIVQVNGDEKVELDETFFLNLSGIAAGGRDVTFADSQGLGTITNDDAATLSINDITQAETDAGTTAFTFTVTLNSEVDTGVSFDFATANDTATTADSDYTGLSTTTRNFASTAAGATETITVQVNGDEKVELDETFFLNLSGIAAGGRDVTFADSQGQGTITNDDAATLSINDITQAETDAGTTAFTFTVTLNSEVDTGVSFDFATANDTATTADSDYTGISTTTRNFASTAAGATETITVQVNGDEKVELNETFFLNLSGIAAGGRDVTFADSQGLGTITNDDAATLSINDITQAETDAGTTAFTFTVTLNSEVDTGVSFDFATANDTATTADSDYTGISTTTRNFASTAAGATETITVQVNGDEKVELNETFFLNLSGIAAGGRDVTFADSQGLGTITNDDAATLSINDITQAETDAGTTAFTFTVTLNSEVDTGVSFDFATAYDTATTADSDYTGISTTTRNFASTAAGATETITVQVNGDTTIEPDETFFVNLSSIAAGGRDVMFAGGGGNQGLGTITNDDNSVDAMIDGSGNLVLEESGENTIDVLTISSDGTDLTITDATNPLGTGGVVGSTGDGTTTITIPLTAFTGGIIINSQSNDDSLTVDFGGGANFDRTIDFNGGSTMQTGGDELFLQGGGTFALADFTFDNLNDGSIDVTGNQTISYNGLEPITSTITATDVTLNYSTAAETITVTDAGSSQTTVDSTAGEIVTFNNPTGTLTVNAGDTGSDTITLQTLDASYAGAVALNGEGGTDAINLWVAPAGSTISINGGDNTDTISLGSTADSMGGLLGTINVNGDAHDAGTLTESITADATTVSVTLDTGDILNLNDQGDAGSFTYTLTDTTFDRTGTGTVTYSTIETLLLNTSMGAADVNVTTTAAGITSITTQSAADDIDVTATAAGSILGIESGGGADAVDVATTGAGSVSFVDGGDDGDALTLADSGAGSGVELNGDAAIDMLTVNGAGSGSATATEGGTEADVFEITPAMMASISVLGDDPSMSPGDTVNFNTPPAQSVTLTPSGIGGGTFSTTGGFGDVTFDEIESLTFTGDVLEVNGSAQDDLFDLTLTAPGAGTLDFTGDVDGTPGPTFMISLGFSGLEQLIANGDDGDDVFRQNNTGGPLGLMNGIEFNGGAGSDSLEVVGGTASTVLHTFANSSDGSITIDTFGLDYTGLEPILDTITATDRTFTFAGTADDITLSDLGGGMSRISSVSSSETVDFTNPTGSLTINAGDGADTVDASASAVAVTINGGGGADDITGTPLADAINGDADNDTITGGVGNDVIDGGANDDLLIWNNGDGSDMMDGGAGTDELEVNGSTVSPAGDMITISANATRFDLARADGGVGLGAFSLDVGTIETLDLNTLDGDDSVTVNDLTGIADLATLTIEVGAGNDTVDASALPNLGLSVMIEGGDDDDTLTGSAGPSIINGNMGNDELNGGAADDTIMGGGGDDVIDGAAGADMLSGQAGDDTLTGGLGGDTLNGGADTDQIIESGDTDFDLGDATLVSPLFGTDTLMDVEEADLNGGASANTIDASDFSGVSTLMGGDNDDTITGALGASAINGNMGNDELTGLGAADTIMGGGGDDLMDGGAGGDMLTGQAGDDTMTGGLGDDTLNGGADTDRIVESGDTDFDLGDATLVSPLFGTDTLMDVEEADLNGGASTNTIDASDFSGVATLMGGDNDDTITEAMGASAINGNMGNDELTGLGAADTIMGGGGDDLMDGGAGGDMLTGQAGDDTMTGGLDDDTMNGGADTDLIVESGDTDFDLGDASLVSPLFGTDTLIDVEEADLNGGASANTIDASDFSGVATLMGGDSNDTITGAMGASAINGNADDDMLTGLGASDTIMGGGGNDAIDGGAGDDTLTGQANDDTIIGGLGDDNIMGGDDNDLINGSLGNDTISGDDDRIQGSNLSDYPGNPQSPIADLNTINMSDMDSLLGGAGADTIAGAIGADFIDGEGDADIIDAQSGGDTTDGIDTIVGGAGDIIFRDPEDTVL